MTIALILKLLILSSNVATVDRVEGDAPHAAVAVVCTAETCINVPTVRGTKGLKEGQLVACETFTRGDGTRAVVCQGRTIAFIGVDGTRHVNPYSVPAGDDCAVY